MTTAALVAAFAATGLPASATELRLGIYDHNTSAFGSRLETKKPDINVELLLPSPDVLGFLWAPRPAVGANINTGSGTSIYYAGLTWTWDFAPSFFLEGHFGGAAHDGETKKLVPRKLRLGCRVMFHEYVSLGYRISDSASIMATVDHMSNASLCDHNPGLTSAGVRFGYSF